jgi:hypothetical protein
MLENVFKDREEEGFKRAEVSGLLTVVLSDDSMAMQCLRSQAG